MHLSPLSLSLYLLLLVPLMEVSNYEVFLENFLNRKARTKPFRVDNPFTTLSYLHLALLTKVKKSYQKPQKPLWTNKLNIHICRKYTMSHALVH